MRIGTVVLLVAATMLVAASAAHAFNGKRRGFILGFGVGGGLTSFTQTLTVPAYGYDETSGRENEFSIATDFKIGGGFNEQFLLYYVNRVSWFSIENVFEEDVTIANSVGLVGVSYYFQQTAPSPYLLGLVGVSMWDAPFESGASSQTGFGIGGGVGWEFSRHWSLEATINWGLPRDKESGIEVKTNAFSVLVTINGLAY